MFISSNRSFLCKLCNWSINKCSNCMNYYITFLKNINKRFRFHCISSNPIYIFMPSLLYTLWVSSSWYSIYLCSMFCCNSTYILTKITRCTNNSNNLARQDFIHNNNFIFFFMISIKILRHLSTVFKPIRKKFIK